MAAKAEDSAHPPEMVGNAFVEQYYNMLCQAPENVHKFYQNSSVISRPSSKGSMSSVSTLDGIDKMILSLDYKNCLVEILTADSQASIGNGVIVLVTGYVDSDEVDPQDRDIANLVATVSVRTADIVLEEGAGDPEVMDSTDPLDNEDTITSDQTDAADNVDATSQDDNQSISDDPIPTDVRPGFDSSNANSLEDTPRKSYASVANALNFKKQPFHQRNSTSKPIEKPEMTASAPSAAPVPAPPPPPVASPLPSSTTTVEKNTSPMAKGHSIFVANLPMNATSEQLREIFEQFGPIKPDGIRVRSYKLERNCFGFVEFETAESMHSALKATSLMIGNRNAHIEEKKASSDGAKYPSRKGSFKNRGNYPGRGYARNEPENQERISRSNGQTHQNGGGRQSQVLNAES